MKKALITLFVLSVMVALAASQVQAADSGGISVTVTVSQTLDMTVTPGGWSVASVAEGATVSTFDPGAQGSYTVTNQGNGTSYMDIKAAITGGCSIGSGPGADTFFIGHGQATGGPTTWTEAVSYTEITDTDTDLATVSPVGTYLFDLQLQTPSSTTYGGEAQTITVTITAKAL